MQTVLKAAPLPAGLRPPTFYEGMDPQTMKTWLQASACAKAYNANQNLIIKYHTETFGTWLTSYSMCRTPYNELPPAPPASWVVIVEEDGMTCTPMQIGEPVCPTPVAGVDYQQMPAPANPANNAIASSGPDRFSAATPVMTPIKAPDGSTWVRVA